jgi:hypothetical protein
MIAITVGYATASGLPGSISYPAYLGPPKRMPLPPAIAFAGIRTYPDRDVRLGRSRVE